MQIENSEFIESEKRMQGETLTFLQVNFNVDFDLKYINNFFPVVKSF